MIMGLRNIFDRLTCTNNIWCCHHVNYTFAVIVVFAIFLGMKSAEDIYDRWQLIESTRWSVLAIVSQLSLILYVHWITYQFLYEHLLLFSKSLTAAIQLKQLFWVDSHIHNNIYWIFFLHHESNNRTSQIIDIIFTNECLIRIGPFKTWLMTNTKYNFIILR